MSKQSHKIVDTFKKFNSKRKDPRSYAKRRKQSHNYIPSYINSKRKKRKRDKIAVLYNSGPEITQSESPKYPRPQNQLRNLYSFRRYLMGSVYKTIWIPVRSFHSSYKSNQYGGFTFTHFVQV